jgi:hypothetical protein
MIGIDINGREIRALADEFGATQAQVEAAYRRALNRTASNVRTLMRREVRQGLDLRSAGVLRRRLKQMRGKGKANGASVDIWLGQNDLPPGAFKDRPRQGGSGVTFRGQSFPGAFVARMPSGKVSIWRRRSDGRLPLIEQTISVQDQMNEVLETRVMPDVLELFMRNFRADLRARTVFGVGN